ncbi:MAG: LON peptidase substrate-binding domain-containing protein, partial [Candidatus Omnitrophica bacterium]|nr:LON peptidase substrate-binding domain-containing protein [Candidatus Omnitrophota bacterium]
MKNKIPLLPIRDLVIFPHMIMSLLVGREKSIKALEKVVSENKILFLCTQKNHLVELPKMKDLYSVGVIVEVLQSLRLPDGSFKIVIGARERAKITKMRDAGGYDRVEVELLKEGAKQSLEAEAFMRSIVSQFDEYAKLNSKISAEIIVSVNSISSPSELSDVIAAQLSIRIPEKQKILEEINSLERLKKLNKILNSEIEILRIEQKILGNVRKQLDKSQKDYYLQEQLRAIEKELGYKAEEKNELEELKRKVCSAGMSKEAKEAALREVGRLERMNPVSPEGAVARNYIDWLVRLPWNKNTKERLNIK